MDRKKAKKLFKLYGRPAFKVKGKKTVLVFARQDMKDAEEIERLTDKELKSEWKSLVWMNLIYGQVSLNDMQRIDLIELEMDTRKKIKPEKLREWFEKQKKKFKIEDYMRKD